MRHYLAFLSLSFIFYLLSFVYPVQAKETSPSPFFSFEDKKGKLLSVNSLAGRNIPDTLEEINKASLPFGVGEGIKPVEPQREEEEKEQELNIQADEESTSSADKTDSIAKTASHYTIATSVRTPQTVSINVIGFFKKLLGDLLKLIGIRKIGNKQARKFAGTRLPREVPEKLLSQQLLPGNQNSEAQSGTVSQKAGRVEISTQVLGLAFSDNEKEAMTIVLPIMQCGDLPYGMCRDNLLEIPPPDEEIPPPDEDEDEDKDTGLKLNYNIPYYKTNTESGLEIDQVADRFFTNAQIIVTAVEKVWPGSLISYWREVYDLSLKQNWNPAFVLAVWIEETAASDVCSIESRQGRNGIWDFGVVSLPKSYCSDEMLVRLEKFRKQLSAFLSLVEKYKSWYDKSVIEFEEFMCRYSEGHYPCTFNTNPGFVKRLKPVYDCLVGKNPSSDVCPSGYFAF